MESHTERERLIREIDRQYVARLDQDEDFETLTKEITEKYPEYAEELIERLEVVHRFRKARKPGPVDEELKKQAAEILSSWARSRRKLEAALKDLTPKQRIVLRLRFGLTDDGRRRSLEESAMELGLSRTRVKRIEWQAIESLSQSEKLKGIVEEGDEESDQS